MSAGRTDRPGTVYDISRTAGVLISCATIAASALLILGLVHTVIPSALDDALGVFLASLLIPIIAAFKPLQTFILFPEGLGFDSIFSRQLYKVPWSDVTDVRLKRNIFGLTNLEFRKKNNIVYKKVPLTIMPKRREFLVELIEVFPLDHPQRSLLEVIVQSHMKE